MSRGRHDKVKCNIIYHFYQSIFKTTLSFIILIIITFIVAKKRFIVYHFYHDKNDKSDKNDKIFFLSFYILGFRFGSFTFVS